MYGRLTRSKPRNVRRGRQRSDEIFSRRGVISLPRRFIFPPVSSRSLFVILTPALQHACLHYEIKSEEPRRQGRHSTISTFSPLAGIPGRSIGNSGFRRPLFFPGIQSLGSARDWYLLNDAMASLQYFREIRNCDLRGIRKGTIFVIENQLIIEIESKFSDIEHIANSPNAGTNIILYHSYI